MKVEKQVFRRSNEFISEERVRVLNQKKKKEKMQSLLNRTKKH